MEEKIKVLILEDLSSDAELAEREVKSVLKNYKTVFTNTEQGFIKALESFKPDLVISDYMLPAFNGMKALQITRKKEEYIPFIILTGSMNEETAVECMKAGADDYVIKEHIRRLGPAVISALDKKKTRQDRKQAVEALWESEMKFRNLSESTLMGIALYQNDYWIYANPAAEEITGYTFDELKQMKFWEFTAPEYVDLIKERGKARQKGKPATSGYEFKIITKQGKEKWILLTGNTTELKSGKAGLISVIDITERKRAEEKLKESEEKYRKIFENVQDIFYQVDTEGNIIEISPSIKRYSGFSREELIGTPVAHVYHNPNDRALLQAELVKKGEVVDYELRLKTKSIRLIYVSLNAHILYDENKKPAGIEGSLRDITERKQAEAELTKLSTAVKQSPSVIAISDTDGNLEYVNPKFTEITGYSLEEAIGQNPRVLKSGEHPFEMYKELWETISSGKTYRCEMHNKKKNGELFWESASISPIFDEQGRISNYIKVAEDITGQKRNEQIQSIIHNISNAVITSDSPENFLTLVKEELGRLIDTTNFFVALYDEKTDRISLPLQHDEKDKWESYPAGKTLTHYVIKTGKSLLARKAMIEKLIKSGEVEQVGHPSEVWLGVPLKSGDKITGIFAVQSYNNEKAYDQSDLRTLEIISQQISISLERKKADHDLKLALEKAQESDRLKSAFLMNMSHEIRTPMNGILGFTELLKEPQLSGDEKDEYIAIIDKSGHRMLDTINDIMDISRIEAGQVKIVQTEVSLNQILGEQFNFFRNEAKSKGLELFYKPTLSEKEANIVTDQHKLEGILSNLIKNAIKYTEKGSITLACSIKKGKDLQFLEFYVEDTGIGIPSDRTEAVFNRFEQADISDTRAYQGSGLGLAISKSYVEMLGGKISVSSKKGAGSTFTFSIPYINLHKEEVKRKGEPLTENYSLFNNLSVMVAEDDESSTRLFKMIFKNRFKKITYTCTGKETIEQCRRNPDTDIILMDIKMPDLNGYKATREIRKFNPDVIIIAQTAFGLAGDREKALEAGCTDYISKPIKKEALFDMIRKYLNPGK